MMKEGGLSSESGDHDKTSEVTRGKTRERGNDIHVRLDESFHSEVNVDSEIYTGSQSREQAQNRRKNHLNEDTGSEDDGNEGMYDDEEWHGGFLPQLPKEIDIDLDFY